MKCNSHFAEVVESSLTGWVAQSWQWDQFPEFGALVTISSQNRFIFGVVHQVQTGSMDPVRYPFPYKKTHEELLAEQPQIFEFLKTTFSCLIVGYQQQNALYYLLAPEPPKIHSFVAISSQEQTKRFFSSQKYLHLLFNLSGHVFNIDELILALLRQQKLFKLLSQEGLAQFVQTYSLLTGNDYRRIKLFLQRVEQVVD